MAMAMKHCKCFSAILIIAMVSMCNVESRPLNLNLCLGADYKPLCQKVIRGQKSPLAATDQVVHELMRETNKATNMLMRSPGARKSQAAQVCRENYDDALFDLRTCLTNQKRHDKDSFKSNLAAVIDDYVTCDDAYVESGEVSPVRKINKRMQHIADIGLYLESMV